MNMVQNKSGPSAVEPVSNNSVVTLVVDVVVLP